MSQGLPPGGWQQQPPPPFVQQQPLQRPPPKGMPGWVIAIIVIAVMAFVGVPATCLLVGTVATGKFGEEQKRVARADVLTIHPIAEQHRLTHSGKCVTVAQLQAERELSASGKVTDPWGSEYVIRCSGPETTVISLGPDKTEGTADDIRTP